MGAVVVVVVVVRLDAVSKNGCNINVVCVLRWYMGLSCGVVCGVLVWCAVCWCGVRYAGVCVMFGVLVVAAM